MQSQQPGVLGPAMPQAGRQTLSRTDAAMFADGFPKQLRASVCCVCGRIPMRTYHNAGSAASEEPFSWLLPDGQAIAFPYRLYILDSVPASVFTPVQQTIYHCLFSRSCDGFVRERHIGALLEGEPPLWAIPYILKVCDEYVVEILELIYSRLAQRDTKWYRQLFSLNPRALLSGYSRMISYWNEYYRERWSSYRQYVGYRLYRECFGYTDALAGGCKTGLDRREPAC